MQIDVVNPTIVFLIVPTEVNLKGGVVHVVAQFEGRTLYDVKHNVCKIEAATFGCPMHEGEWVLYSHQQLCFVGESQWTQISFQFMLSESLKVITASTNVFSTTA